MAVAFPVTEVAGFLSRAPRVPRASVANRMDDGVVRGLYDAGAAAHPTVRMTLDRFAARLGERAVGADARAGDLFLAVACEEKDPAALAAFETEMIGRLRSLLRRIESDRELIDELVQVLRVRVLVGTGEIGPRIATYTGSGSLVGWLKVMAVRLHANAARDRKRSPVSAADSDQLDDHAATLIAPERAILGGRHGPALHAALSAGLRALPARERTLLRFHYVEGVALERIGAMYGVHKGTVSRWLQAARDQLVESTLAKLGVEGSTEELLSLCRQVLSRIDLTLSALRVEAPDGLS